jgi:hypothetical protein
MLVSASQLLRCSGIIIAITASGFSLAAAPFTPKGTVAGVIELFTSQGCSSCPPADRLLSTMARNPNVVALSFPVDYWDYIGWKDTLAAPEFTTRQEAYAAARGDGHVYTPEAVVDGLVDAVGSDKAEIDRAIQAGKARALTVPMHLIESGGTLQIDIGGGGAATAGIYVLRVAKAKTVLISRGENSGHSVTYTNVVRAMHKVGDWNGAPESLKLTELKGDGEGYVVLVQQGTEDRPGAILAAAKSVGL